MTQHDHNHQHDHKHGHQHAGKRNQGLHKDWRLWVVVILALAAMAMYVMSDDEALQPGGKDVPRTPAAP